MEKDGWFNNIERLPEEKEDGLGPKRYLDWLKNGITDDRFVCAHVWIGETIIGQVESHRLSAEPHVGYVNLYYLISECRGTGISDELDRYVCTALKAKGCSLGRLSVAPQNKRAWKFYERNDWKDTGPRPGMADVHFMEKLL